MAAALMVLTGARVRTPRDGTEHPTGSRAGAFVVPSTTFVDADAFDLVVSPGCHGPMEDLAVDPVSGRLPIERLVSGRPLVLRCHAPAAVLATVDTSGRSPFGE